MTQCILRLFVFNFHDFYMDRQEHVDFLLVALASVYFMRKSEEHGNCYVLAKKGHKYKKWKQAEIQKSRQQNQAKENPRLN